MDLHTSNVCNLGHYADFLKLREKYQPTEAIVGLGIAFVDQSKLVNKVVKTIEVIQSKCIRMLYVH